MSFLFKYIRLCCPQYQNAGYASGYKLKGNQTLISSYLHCKIQKI